MLRSLAARLSLSEILEHHLEMPGRWAQETCTHGEACGSVLCDAFPMGARLEVTTETAQGECRGDGQEESGRLSEVSFNCEAESRAWRRGGWRSGVPGVKQKGLSGQKQQEPQGQLPHSLPQLVLSIPAASVANRCFRLEASLTHGILKAHWISCPLPTGALSPYAGAFFFS